MNNYLYCNTVLVPQNKKGFEKGDIIKCIKSTKHGKLGELTLSTVDNAIDEDYYRAQQLLVVSSTPSESFEFNDGDMVYSEKKGVGRIVRLSVYFFRVSYPDVVDPVEPIGDERIIIASYPTSGSVFIPKKFIEEYIRTKGARTEVRVELESKTTALRDEKIGVFAVIPGFSIKLNEDRTVIIPEPDDSEPTIDYYDATKQYCVLPAAIQATATQLIAHGYKHMGASENNDNVILMNHDKKTFSTTLDISRLLVPRIQVRADYPGSPYKKLQYIEFDESSPMAKWPEEYPDIFSRTKWFYDREKQEMPQYLKHKKNGTMYEVERYVGLSECKLKYDRFGSRWLGDFLPATKEEYKQHLKP